jgi:DNA-binding NtrC family response regulator
LVGELIGLSAESSIISIVDDEMDITILFRNALSIVTGISIFTFTDPKLAFEHFRVNKHDYVLIISDLRMPGLSGIELIKLVKDTNSSVRTLLMTAFEVNDNIFQQYMKQNIINGFLQKPISVNDLIKEVKNQIRSYQLQKQK